jgi:hypothetical protein
VIPRDGRFLLESWLPACLATTETGWASVTERNGGQEQNRTADTRIFSSTLNRLIHSSSINIGQLRICESERALVLGRFERPVRHSFWHSLRDENHGLPSGSPHSSLGPGLPEPSPGLPVSPIAGHHFPRDMRVVARSISAPSMMSTALRSWQPDRVRGYLRTTGG